MKTNKLSVVLATRNEEATLAECLKSVESIADEIIVFDENSNDKTAAIAESFGAKVTDYIHKTNFHETKQKAIDQATGDWILQLDADERVSPELAKEIILIINSTNEELQQRTSRRWKNSHPRGGVDPKKLRYFERHQELIKQREGHLGKPTGEVVAFFLPRINYFVGKPLLHAGVYPDGVIRLFKRGKAKLPAKSVHEVMEVDGEVGWLINDLEHHESPTLHRYLARANRYTDLTAKELKAKFKSKKRNRDLFYYSTIKPLHLFLNLYVRHRGYKDGMRGFLWSAFSALHFPLAYWKCWVDKGGVDNG